MKPRLSEYIIVLSAFLSVATIGKCAAVPAARGWEGSIDLPTYALGEEDPNPPFPLINRHNIYPYTMLDDLTDKREMKTYRAIFLENEYLKATILPDVGGRLYSLYDKVSKREVFYRNNVVKYGLVALRGAWISGGIEFNFPNGHTVATVSPVSSRLLAVGPDRASAVVGGMDWVTGMYWQVVLTLHPGESRLEQKVTLFNPTPQEQLYWYWANAAVLATDDMQFIYPMREANPHSNSEIWSYPVWNGVDYSWYKNIRQPTSLFGLGVHRNFFGAYYHKADYGVVHWADYHDVPGKKIWSWGVAGDGLIWTDLLTDHDGPYNEIQAGRFETQLSQEFMPPHHVESWTEYWYPVRGLGGGFVEATDELALNVRFIDRGTGPNHIGAGVSPVSSSGARVELALNPIVDIKGAKISVAVAGKKLREFGPVDLHASMLAKYDAPLDLVGPGLDPAKADPRVGPTEPEAAKQSLSVDIIDSASHPLLHWSAADPVGGNPNLELPIGPQKIESKPLDKMTVEEIYLRGIEQEKHGNSEAAAKSYELALQRDPQHIPALLKLAWRDYDAADFDSALAKIALAEKRDNTNPDVQYAAGVIYRAKGDLTKAQDAFWLSLRFHGAERPTLTELGEIAVQKENYHSPERLPKLWMREGLDKEAAEFFAKAASAPAGKIFPQRLSDVVALKEVIARNPNDSHAHYLLGTFLFAHDRFEDGAKEWLAAKQLGFDDPVLQRNLGIYEWRVKKDLPQAAAYYEKAIQLAPAQYRYYADLDDIYTQIGDVSRRQKLFASAPSAVLDRDIIRARHALLLVEQRQFDQALEILMNHHFKPWEGGQIIREIFVLAQLEKGKHALASKSYQEAERSFRQALEYPVNLGVGKPDKPNDEEAWYWLGVALAAEDKTSAAQQAWSTAVEEGRVSGGRATVFAAAALEGLGQKDQAKNMLTAIADKTNEPEQSAHALYAAGLAERFQNHEQAAQADFRRALEMEPLFWQARFELNRSASQEK